jgi:hypothetical protein
MLTKKARRMKKLLEIGRLRLVIMRQVNLVSLRGGCKINILLKLLHILLRGSQPSLLPFIVMHGRAEISCAVDALLEGAAAICSITDCRGSSKHKCSVKETLS